MTQRPILYRVLFPLLFTCFVLALPGAAFGQNEQATAEGDAVASEVEVTPERVEDLIETLESETARNELIADLKALIAVQEDETEEEPAPELVDAAQLDQAAQAVRESYTEFLESYGLNASLVGYLMATAALVVLILLALWLTRRVFRFFYHRIRPLALRYHLSLQRIAFYLTALRLCAFAVILLVGLVALLTLWGIELNRWLSDDNQLLILQATLSVALVFAVGAFIIELSNATVEWFFKKRLGHQQARMNTLLPITRNLLLLTLFTLFGLTVLSQLGLNVMPLLAGAGVVGFAVGFGAQALIKDVLNGFIVIVEDLIQVGDVAILGGKAGLVEKITIRKVQLRDLNGAVYTVPFSDVSVVENLTKDFSYYLMDVGVAYREDTDRVVALLREIDAGMREEDEYKDDILEPIEILGVDKFADSAVLIKARIKTRPIQQWRIGREFNRRMKQVFDKNNVEIPFPHRTLYFGEDTEGSAPPMRVQMQNLGSANDAVNHDGSAS